MRHCTCMQYDPREAMEKWQKRALPVIRRLTAHGHTIDTKRMEFVVGLVYRLERGIDEGDEVSSQHLPGCPAARRSKYFLKQAPSAKRVPSAESLLAFEKALSSMMDGLGHQ